MRYLNKIIFLNSAHIPYAEVKLDGNVHFIGTQGVGKSTLLRAILFFYNADKLRLGIPKEKKSFDAFYFPFSNSYIVYEVMRENGAYCVVDKYKVLLDQLDMDLRAFENNKNMLVNEHQSQLTAKKETLMQEWRKAESEARDVFREKVAAVDEVISQLADTFKLEFRIKENDNDTGWVEKIANVGSDGTDILVKAMVNIMLINVFKEKASKKSGDFKIHCMMDEIGKLHPNNVKGILDFANRRNILLVNSSPTTYNVEDYKYTYLLSKDGKANTKVVQLIKRL